MIYAKKIVFHRKDNNKVYTVTPKYQDTTLKIEPEVFGKLLKICDVAAEECLFVSIDNLKSLFIKGVNNAQT